MARTSYFGKSFQQVGKSFQQVVREIVESSRTSTAYPQTVTRVSKMQPAMPGAGAGTADTPQAIAERKEAEQKAEKEVAKLVESAKTSSLKSENALRKADTQTRLFVGRAQAQYGMADPGSKPLSQAVTERINQLRLTGMNVKANQLAREYSSYANEYNKYQQEAERYQGRAVASGQQAQELSQKHFAAVGKREPIQIDMPKYERIQFGAEAKQLAVAEKMALRKPTYEGKPAAKRLATLREKAERLPMQAAALAPEAARLRAISQAAPYFPEEGQKAYKERLQKQVTLEEKLSAQVAGIELGLSGFEPYTMTRERKALLRETAPWQIPSEGLAFLGGETVEAFVPEFGEYKPGIQFPTFSGRREIVVTKPRLKTASQFLGQTVGDIAVFSAATLGLGKLVKPLFKPALVRDVEVIPRFKGEIITRKLGKKVETFYVGRVEPEIIGKRGIGTGIAKLFYKPKEVAIKIGTKTVAKMPRALTEVKPFSALYKRVTPTIIAGKKTISPVEYISLTLGKPAKMPKWPAKVPKGYTDILVPSYEKFYIPRVGALTAEKAAKITPYLKKELIIGKVRAPSLGLKQTAKGLVTGLYKEYKGSAWYFIPKQATSLPKLVIGEVKAIKSSLPYSLLPTKPIKASIVKAKEAVAAKKTFQQLSFPFEKSFKLRTTAGTLDDIFLKQFKTPYGEIPVLGKATVPIERIKLKYAAKTVGEFGIGKKAVGYKGGLVADLVGFKQPAIVGIKEIPDVAQIGIKRAFVGKLAGAIKLEKPVGLVKKMTIEPSRLLFIEAKPVKESLMRRAIPKTPTPLSKTFGTTQIQKQLTKTTTGFEGVLEKVAVQMPMKAKAPAMVMPAPTVYRIPEAYSTLAVGLPRTEPIGMIEYKPPKTPLDIEFATVITRGPRLGEYLGKGISPRVESLLKEKEFEKLIEEPATKQVSFFAEKPAERLGESLITKVSGLTTTAQRQAYRREVSVAQALGVQQAPLTRTRMFTGLKTAQAFKTQVLPPFEYTPMPFLLFPLLPTKPIKAPIPKQKIMQGFEVFVVKKGKPVKVTKQPLAYRTALGLGARETETAARTFFLKSARAPGKRVPSLERLFKPERFRRPRGKTRLPPTAFVERAKFAIDYPKELEEITYKGLKSRKRTGLLSLTGFKTSKKKKSKNYRRSII